MVEALRNGISINNLLPSEPDTTINHGTSKTLGEQDTCRFGARTQDGSKSSNMKVTNSSTGKMAWLLTYLNQRMKKVKE